jgi:hypothetical protein
MVGVWTHRNIQETLLGDGNGNDIAVLGGDALKAANFAGFLINVMTWEIKFLRGRMNGLSMSQLLKIPTTSPRVVFMTLAHRYG